MILISCSRPQPSHVKQLCFWGVPAWCQADPPCTEVTPVTHQLHTSYWNQSWPSNSQFAHFSHVQPLRSVNTAVAAPATPPVEGTTPTGRKNPGATYGDNRWLCDLIGWFRFQKCSGDILILLVFAPDCWSVWWNSCHERNSNPRLRKMWLNPQWTNDFFFLLISPKCLDVFLYILYQKADGAKFNHCTCLPFCLRLSTRQ